MGGSPSTPKAPKIPTPQENEVKARGKTNKRLARVSEQDTLLTSDEERVKLLGLI